MTERLALPWWVRRGLAKDPDLMTPEERDAAQLILLQQWLWRIGVDSTEARVSPRARDLQRLRKREALLLREQRRGAA